VSDRHLVPILERLHAANYGVCGVRKIATTFVLWVAGRVRLVLGCVRPYECTVRRDEGLELMRGGWLSGLG